MSGHDDVALSKRLSLVLRHRPDRIGLTLGPGGWVGVDELLEALGRHGRAVTLEALTHVVETSDKQRFALQAGRIRANQGHSVEVDLGLSPSSPPAVLWHGTHPRALDSIRAQGLVRGARHHVHLSTSPAVATTVGARRGSPVLLQVDAAAMQADGHVFRVSANGVWLTDHVPARYLGFPA